MVRLAPLAFVASLATFAYAGVEDDRHNERKHHLSSEKLQHDIKLKALKDHAARLQGFANKGNGTRVFGSKGHILSVDYVAALVEKAGYDVTRQTFAHEYSEVRAQHLVAGGSNINIAVMTYSPSTPAGGVTAPLVLIPDTEAAPSPGCTPGDFAGVDVTGKIALLQRGACTFAAKTTNAKAAGAVGLVVYNNVDGPLSGTLGAPSATAYTPVGGITRADGEALVAALAAGPVSATLEVITFTEQRSSTNVIASSKSGNQNNVVFAGAHLDSVFAGPGLNDNGSGSIAILELAIRLAKYKLNNAVRFAWWTAEEFGLVGSEYHVEHLSQEERDKIALYLNFDMVASPNFVYGVYDGDGSSGTNPGPTPPGSGAIEKVFTDWYASKGIPSIPSAFTGRSDYGPFIAPGVDIAAGGLFTGAEVPKTEEQAALFGGTAGVAYDVNYHQKGDTYDNLNFEAFLVNAKAAAHAVATFVESTEVVEAEKAAGAARRVTPLPHDKSAMQGKHICGGDVI